MEEFQWSLRDKVRLAGVDTVKYGSRDASCGGSCSPRGHRPQRAGAEGPRTGLGFVLRCEAGEDI